MAKQSILLIDDNFTVARLLGLFLSQTEFADVGLVHAESAEAGLTALQSHTPNLILLDNYLGAHATFHEPLRMLREITDVPIVLLTGAEMEELGYETLPAELDGYIAKQALNADNLSALLGPFLPSAAD